MRRRDVLRGAAGSLSLSALAGGAAARSQPDEYAPLGQVSLEGAKEAVVGADGYVYVAVTDGFAVVDVSDPENPAVAHENRSVWSDHESGPLRAIYDVKVDGDRLAMTGPANPGPELQGVVVYDVSDPTAPERVSVHETDFFNHNCDISGGVVYLCGNDGERNPLVTVDAETGEELGRWSVVSEESGWQDVRFIHWPLHDVKVQDGVAYLAYWDAGTWLVDVSDPAEPTLHAKVRGEGPEKYADMTRDESFEAGRQPPGNDHFVAPNDDGDLLGISVEAWDVDPPEEDVRPGSVHLYDVSDPQSPAKVAEIEAPPTEDEGFDGVWTTSHNFEFAGDRLYTSWYRGGVKVHDVSDPSAPERLAQFRDSATTSFWTAQHATARFFVASSRKDPSQMPEDASPAGDGPGAAVYTFPNPGGPTPTPSPTPSSTPTASDTPTATTPVSQPGFGPLAGALALGAGVAWRALGRERDDD